MRTFIAFIFIFTLGFYSQNTFAQLTVSTLPENKNVLIEEFTGPVCASCPSGHKRSKQIIDLNPENVFEMKIIDEGFSFSSFDLSLTEGEVLSQNANLIAFPQATINRKAVHQDTMAIFQNEWEDITNSTLTESAYVNIASKGTLNMQTRLLTIEVKAYFTGNGTSDNKINIALLQSHIEGMQFGKDDNHGNILPNGEYEHNHILRHLITGQWGENIVTTSQGTLYSNTFYYTLPTSIESIPLLLTDVELLVFISEGQNAIINVDKTEIDFIIPTTDELIDIELASSNQPTNSCDNLYTPSVSIVNNGINPINQYKITYYINEDMYDLDSIGSETFNTTILPGASSEISFPPIPISYPINLMGYTIEILDPNRIDLNSGDNWFTEKVYYLDEINTMQHLEDFEDFVYYLGLYTAVVKNEYPILYGISKANTGTTYEMGGHGNSLRSVSFDFYNSPEDTEASIQFNRIDFTNNQLYGLTFSYAYARRDELSNDRFKIEITADCGETWETVFNQSGASLATTNDFKTNSYIPNLNEWQTTTLDISNFAGNSEVSIKMTGISDHGNVLYLDDVKFGPDATVGINDLEIPSIKVFPNPASNTITIELNNSVNTEIELVNTLGQTVLTKTSKNNSNIDISNLDPGMYLVKIKTEKDELLSKIIKH